MSAPAFNMTAPAFEFKPAVSNPVPTQETDKTKQPANKIEEISITPTVKEQLTPKKKSEEQTAFDKLSDNIVELSKIKTEVLKDKKVSA